MKNNEDKNKSTEKHLFIRRERVFLILAGFFIGSMALLNIIGITRFIELGPFILAVGVLPYPLTFLCTDLVCELYGKKRANDLVFVGLLINGFILFILWLGDLFPSVPEAQMPPWQNLKLAEAISTPSGQVIEGEIELYHLIYYTTTGAVLASMFAYLSAQFCDVALFHFWKRVTKGKHLWVRNIFSTVFSQIVDSFMVVAVTFGMAYFRAEVSFAFLTSLFLSNYAFKFCAALIDTLPFYVLVKYLSKYLQIDTQKVD